MGHKSAKSKEIGVACVEVVDAWRKEKEKQGWRILIPDC